MIPGGATAGGATPAASTMDVSGVMFGICCCTQKTGKYTRLYATGDQFGFSPMPVSASVQLGGVGATRKWTQIDTTLLMTAYPASGPPTNVLVSSTMLMDNNNGSIATHTISGLPAGTTLAVPAAGTIRPLSEAASVTETDAVWHDGTLGDYQTIHLSSSNDAGSARTLAGALLVSWGDMTGLSPQGHVFHIYYPVQSTSFFEGPSSGDWPIGGYTTDSPPVAAWTPCNNSYPEVGDSTIPAYVTPVAQTDDLGPFTEDFTSFSTWGGWASWTAGRVLVETLSPSSIHCLQTLYDFGAQALGDGNNCGDAAAETSGNLLVLEPTLDYDTSGDQHVASSSDGHVTIYLYAHATGGASCPCVYDL